MAADEDSKDRGRWVDGAIPRICSFASHLEYIEILFDAVKIRHGRRRLLDEEDFYKFGASKCPGFAVTDCKATWILLPLTSVYGFLAWQLNVLRTLAYPASQSRRILVEISSTSLEVEVPKLSQQEGRAPWGSAGARVWSASRECEASRVQASLTVKLPPRWWCWWW